MEPCGNAIAEASQAAHLAIASFQLEAAVCEELHHERDHVDVGDHAQQLKMETTQPNRVIGRGSGPTRTTPTFCFASNPALDAHRSGALLGLWWSGP